MTGRLGVSGFVAHRQLASGRRRCLFLTILLTLAPFATVLAQDVTLFQAARDGTPNQVARALDSTPVDTRDQYGQTPLMYAVEHNTPDVVAQLLGSGADPNAVTTAGWTVLNYALRGAETTRTIDLLLQAGANPTNLHYETYENDVYDYTIPLPSGFDMSPHPRPSDGRRLARPAGGATITIYGHGNVRQLGLSERFERARVSTSERNVTYAQSGDSWFVVSGESDGRVSYLRQHRGGKNRWLTLVVEYDANLAPLLDPITSHVSTNLIVEDARIETPAPDTTNARAGDSERTLLLTEPRLNGPDVRTVQRILLDHGYLDGPSEVDGWYGPVTEGAVRAFQRDAGLDVDGVVGPRTRSALLDDVTYGKPDTPVQPAGQADQAPLRAPAVADDQAEEPTLGSDEPPGTRARELSRDAPRRLANDPRDPPFLSLMFRSQTFSRYRAAIGSCDDNPTATHWIETNHPTFAASQGSCTYYDRADLHTTVRALLEDLDARGYNVSRPASTWFNVPGSRTGIEGAAFRAEIDTPDFTHALTFGVASNSFGTLVIILNVGM